MKVQQIIIRDLDDILAELMEVLARLSSWRPLGDEMLR